MNIQKRVFLVIALLVSTYTYGQNFVGSWKGVMDIGGGQQLHLVFFIQEVNGKLMAKMQSPDQSMQKIGCSKTFADKDSITITVAYVDGFYKGKISGNTINGMWSQSGGSAPLNLEKSTQQAAAKQPALKDHSPTSLIDSVVADAMAEQHIPGLSLGIIKDGKLLVCKGYGWANLKDSIPATEKTVYKIGSLSKHVIATCVMRLSEQGKLSLSDPIQKYYPDAPAEWGNITIRNLLDHTSGLEREATGFNWMKIQPDSVLIRASYKSKLVFATGTSWQYSNLGYFVLADIIRIVSGQSFEDYMNQFFKELELVHTTTTDRDKEKGRSIGYKYYNNTSGKYAEAVDFIALRPSGAFVSNITDMIKWDSIQRHSNVLSKQGWSQIWQDTVQSGTSATGAHAYYGYGWGVLKYKGKQMEEHGGSTLGFKTEYWKFIDETTSIIIFTNTDEATPGKIARSIADVLYSN